jgi:hypothetical protein
LNAKTFQNPQKQGILYKRTGNKKKPIFVVVNRIISLREIFDPTSLVIH